MKIAVIGGSGFIGTALVTRLLASNHDVMILDKEESKTFPNLCTICDVRDVDALTENLKNIHTVYNLAAEHRDDVRPIQLYYDVNVSGAENIVKAAEANDVKAIYFTSTVALYGLDINNADENNPVAPFNDYGRSKAQAEGIFKAWQNNNTGRKLIILRPTVVFGPTNRGNVYNLINQVARNRFLFIGNGKNKKSLAYVDNISAFLEFMLSIEAGYDVFNYSDKPDLNMMDLIATLKKELGFSNTGGLKIPFVIGLLGGYCFDLLAFVLRRKLPISSVRIKKFCANSIINADKLHASGFKPSYSVTEGLEKTIEVDF